MKQLFEYGEKRIIKDLIYKTFPHLNLLHGDAVDLSTSLYSSISLSTDPCPEPIVAYFDKENRYYHYGFLSVVINYSDLAASGSDPIGILLSIVMPNQMMDFEFQNFLNGVKDACHYFGGKLLGGNIKDGKEFSVTGTAIGAHTCGNVLTRKGMKSGDLICTIGDLGMFWLGILQLMEGKNIKELDDYSKSFLINPRPKVKESKILAKSGLVTTCMDNSDGIINCLYELAELNNLTLHLDDRQFVPNENLAKYCKKSGIDYRNLLLSFGGWDLVFACAPENISELENIFTENNLSFKVIGYSTSNIGEPVVYHKNNHMYRVNDFSSKRFDKHSYFSFGLTSFTEQFHANNFEEMG